MKYEFLQINNFVANHSGEQFFDNDLKLFKKLFPESPILKTLETAMPFQKKTLDERMIIEILQADRVCIETIWEYRGVVKSDKSEAPEKPEKPSIDEVPGTAPANTDFQAAIERLKNTALDTAKHNDLKRLIYDLSLEGRCVNHKKDTYIQVLTDALEALAPAPIAASEPEPEKKKEAPAPSIPA